MPSLVIDRDDPRRDDVRALLESHLAFAAAQSPREHVHAIDGDGLTADGITFFSIRSDGVLLGVGALKEIEPGHGEIKSMHTAAFARGQGVGRAMVEHLLATARQRGYHRVSLETGTMDAFAPARSLYAFMGFVECPPFAGYWENEYSVCMTLELD
jgi:putative acetyltransferase